jgi:hypothetical protein
MSVVRKQWSACFTGFTMGSPRMLKELSRTMGTPVSFPNS